MRAFGYQSPLDMRLEHDLLHEKLCAWLGLSDSFVLQCVTGLRDEDNVSAAEEEAVRAIYKFIHLAGISVVDIKV